MTSAILTPGTVPDEVAEAHQQPDELEVAEADAEPGAKRATYRIFCPDTGDGMEYEPFSAVPLTSLKQARARLKGLDGGTCASEHHIEKLNGLGLWGRYVGRTAGGVKAYERGLEIIIPANPKAPVPMWLGTGVALTITDFFAGCGGSSTGYERVPGLKVTQAINHWDLAISTHQYNLQHADHDRQDISQVDPRRYRRTDIAHFSPECTNWSQAKGKKIDFDTSFLQMSMEDLLDPDSNELDPEAPAAEDAKWRSRLLMSDVVRMTMYHQYEAIVVENVTDILAWYYLPEWIKKICDIGDGYECKTLILNSAFANQMDGVIPPQLRDRVYFLFWKKRYKRPNFAKWMRPKSWCGRCLEVVEGIYTEKPGKPRAMRYGQQYHYRCPKNPNHVVQPFTVPAKAALDLTLPAQRIGDRKKPLRPNTHDRVAAGLDRWGPYLLAAVAGHTYERRPGVRTWPIGQPMPTQTATNTLGMLQPVGGSWNEDAHLTNRPMRAITTTETNALIVPLRNNGVAAPADQEPLPTFAAGGTHHALVMRNNTPRGDAGQMTTPDGEPLRALTTAGHQSVIQCEVTDALFSYDSGTLHSLNEPLPAQTTVEGEALLRAGLPKLTVEDCTLRMLAVGEIRYGMAFSNWFQLLGRSKRDQVKQLGNAVTPNVTAVIGAMLAEILLGIELERWEFDPFAKIW